jgi:alkaline phosphatase D
MMKISRRDFIQMAAAVGAACMWGGAAAASRVHWRERRDLFPEGVASGDPDPTSVILWTRRPFAPDERHRLTVEVAEDPAFQRVIAHASVRVSAESDWTSRVLVGGLKPARTYWYRFTDAEGNGSRIGRTITAPAPDDPRPVQFAFVSCQSVNDGKLNAYRRMIFEDERAAPEDQIAFVLHLGDFIYEVVWYPEDRKTRYDRTIFEVARIPDGEKIGDFHIPLTVDGYRAIYRGYLHDPDLQDARARWPFVAMWDNHEFSWQGWQSIVKAGGPERPGQSVKVAANQAWFEYIPARVARPRGSSLERFDPPSVKNVPIEKFDENGLGDEPNNLIAIRSLTGYRALRYGRHLDLMITDQHSYRSKDPTDHPELDGLGGDEFMGMFPEDAMQILDGGRVYNGGNPPAEIRFEASVPNPRKNLPPQTILGAEQKAWFKDKLRRSTATWKIWGNSLGTLDERADPQNLPPGLTKPWPSDSFASLGGGDYGTAYVERGEIYDVIRDAKITGFAIVSGDRHSFWAGYAAKALPPGNFQPVGLSFVGASIASCDYAKNFDLARARALSNPALAPHLSFVDLSAHGYAKVRLDGQTIRSEFVCIPRPIARSETPDGGPLRYRVVHTAMLWGPGERPKLQQEVLEGDPGLAF